jgi:hypothetical protein
MDVIFNKIYYNKLQNNNNNKIALIYFHFTTSHLIFLSTFGFPIFLKEISSNFGLLNPQNYQYIY